MERPYDVVVVGAGAAGLLCAGTAAGRGLRVLLLEKNLRPGRKILITGKGRCNLTNNCDVPDFLKAVRHGNRFLYSAASRFSPRDTMEFFESLGVELKTERGNRVFPVSDKSSEIVDALAGFIRRSGVEWKQCACREVLWQEGQVTGVLTDEGQTIPARHVVIATGGLSYPLTGSTGDGYTMAQKLGHTLVPTRPSLVPVVIRENWCAQVMGLSLRNVVLSIWDRQSGKKIFEELGEMLFTHFGVSGPLVLSGSSHMEKNPDQYEMKIDLKPALDEKQLDTRLLRDFEKFKNKDFSNSLGELYPRKLIPVMVELSGIPKTAKVHQISKEQRHKLVKLTKGLTLSPKGFRPVEEAVVTAGGVSTGEVNPKTMESKLVSGLYFAGEVLDLDAYTGGYNLQIAFSTGYLAGSSIPVGE